jgi:hypothetical protein
MQKYSLVTVNHAEPLRFVGALCQDYLLRERSNQSTDSAPRFRYPALFLAITFLLLAGCSSVPSDKLSAFSTGVTTAKGQVNTAFAAVNVVTADEVIEFAANQQKLLDENFYAVLDPAAIAKWNAAFDGLSKYSQSLVVLTSPDITKDYKTATAGLASQISETGDKLNKAGLTSSAPSLSPGVATAFAELGNLILKAKASKDAKTIVQKTDPTVARIFHTMADSVDTIRGTVHANWTSKKKHKAAEFNPKAPEADRKKVALEYSDLKDKEAEQDSALASLQRSLLALADAHHALARDSQYDVVAAVAVVKDEAKDTKDIYDQMKKALDKTSSEKSAAATTSTTNE